MSARSLNVSPSLPLPLDFMTMATVVYGARGSGKTTFGAVVAEELDAAGQRFCAIDLKGDFYGLKSTADGRDEGLPVVVFGGDHADLPLEDGAGKFLGELVAGLEQSVVLDFEQMSKGKQTRFLGEFFAALYHKNREPLLVIADEAQRLAPQKPFSPESSVCLGAVEDLVKLGRKHGLGVLLLTQRGAGLNKEVSEICDMLVAFRTPGSIDQERVRDWLGASGFLKRGEDPLAGISGLDNGVALVASAHPDLKVFDTVKMRKRRTFDSSATPRVGEKHREPRVLAKPEIEAIRAQMAGAVERAQQEDPRALRKNLAELQEKCARAARELEQAASEREALEARIEKLVATLEEADARGAEKQARPAVKTDQIARLEKTAQHLKNVSIDVAKHADAIATALSVCAQQAAQPAQPAPTQPSSRWEKFQSTQPAKPPSTASSPRERSSKGSGKLSKCALALLRALLQRDGLTRAQLATLSGYSILSSTFANGLSEVSMPGLVEKRANLVFITAEGKAWAAPATPGTWIVPQTPEQLRALWTSKLKDKAARTMLEILVGRRLTREALATLSHYSITSSTFANGLSKLNTNGLIVKDGNEVMLVEELR